MTAVLQIVVGAFLRELLAAISAYFSALRDEAKSRELGRLEAERDAAMKVERMREELDTIQQPSRDDVIRRLRAGSA